MLNDPDHEVEPLEGLVFPLEFPLLHLKVSLKHLEYAQNGSLNSRNLFSYGSKGQK